MSLSVFSRPALGHQLLALCQAAKRRLWIVSPYVGNWDVRRVLGRSWWDINGIDVRLLTDKDEKRLNRETALRFAEKGQIKSLRGIHAKLYIADDSVLLTSANLTVTAFSRKYEAGVILKGAAAKSAISLFECWWKKADDFALRDVLQLPKKQLRETGEDNGARLPEPSQLPPDPGSFGGQKFVDLFGDYSDFLKCYRQLAAVYSGLPRVWPKIPLYRWPTRFFYSTMVTSRLSRTRSSHLET